MEPERHARAAWSLPLFAFGVSLAFVLVSVVSPYSGEPAHAVTLAPPADRSPQLLVVAGIDATDVQREEYGVTEAPRPARARTGGSAAAPAAPPASPGTAQAIAREMVSARGWGGDQYNCLVALWNRESGWNVYAQNPYSGAYGIPQALPGSKMATAGADWRTNPRTQISWGLNYIQGRYGTPCGAWGHSQSVGWY